MTQTSDMPNEPAGVQQGTDRVVLFLGFILVGFHLYTAGGGQFPPLIQRSAHLGLALAIAYLQLARHNSDHRRLHFLASAANLVLAAIAVVGCGYIIVVEERLSHSFAIVAEPHELVLGVALTFVVLEGARRTTGVFLPALALLLIAYTLLGQLIPGRWGHPGFGFTYLVEHLYLGTEGIWGTVTGLSANLVSIFIIFGAFLLATGAGESFMNIAMVAAGRFRGGAAKVATFSSALFGMLNGAAVANVATTGNFTIPAMKRLGYRPAFAGAVEATASSGGQITPPIMGAGAFIMAELLGTPYLDIMKAAVVPAFLFYVCVWISIDVEARRMDMKPFDERDIPALRDVLKWRKIGPLGCTLAVMLASLFSGNTPALAAFYGICTNVALFMLSGPYTRVAYTEKLKQLANGVRLAVTGVVTIVALLVCAQITLSLIGLTGLGIKLSEQIIIVGAGGGMFLGLVLALLVALILGMGMPTTAAYLLAAAVTVPALTQLGVAPLAAHFFVFYGALLSALTPPVCTAVYTAAVIAKTHWWPIAQASIRLAAMKYVLPFLFIYRPEVLLIGSFAEILWVVAMGVACAYLFAVSVAGHLLNPLHPLVRAVCLAGAVGLLAGNLFLDVAGLFIFVSLVIWEHSRARRLGNVTG